jgi:hypothetical protein
MSVFSELQRMVSGEQEEEANWRGPLYQSLGASFDYTPAYMFFGVGVSALNVGQQIYAHG